MTISKATQRPQSQESQTSNCNAPEEYNIPNGIMYTWEEKNWVYTQKVFNSGITKTTRTLKERPHKPQRIEWKEF